MSNLLLSFNVKVVHRHWEKIAFFVVVILFFVNLIGNFHSTSIIHANNQHSVVYIGRLGLGQFEPEKKNIFMNHLLYLILALGSCGVHFFFAAMSLSMFCIH